MPDVRTCAPRVGLFLAALSLAACDSGEPSQSDMLQAMKSEGSLPDLIRMGVIVGLHGSQRGPDLEKAVDKAVKGFVVEKASCAEAQGAPGYVCDFRMGFPMPDGHVEYGQPGKSRFFKTGAGWSFEQPR
jgi:hypothetical protein